MIRLEVAKTFRSALLLCASLCLTLFLAQAVIAQDFTFVQISDPHISGAKDTKALHQLKAAIREINAMQRQPRFVLITGDIAKEKGSIEAYRRFKKAIDTLKTPIRYVIGNHDNRSNFRQVVLEQRSANDEALYYRFNEEDLSFVVLDSKSEEDTAKGEINPKQRKWMLSQLRSRTRDTILVMHHQLLLVGSADKYPLDNRLQIIADIESFPHVRAVLNGHVHLSRLLCEKGRYYASAMAISYPLIPSAGSPGYRIVQVEKNGTLRFFDKRLGLPAVEETCKEE